MLIIVSITIIVVIFNYVIHLWKIYKYWEIRGVSGPKPIPIFGNYKDVIMREQTEAELLRRIYEDYPQEKYVGIFKGVHPLLVIRDPEMLKEVLIKNFASFNVRHIDEPLSSFDKSLFIMRGDNRWETTRHAMSFGLTKTKMRMMMPLLHECTDNCIMYTDKLILNEKWNKNNQCIEVKDLLNKFMMEIISKLFFGVDMKVFAKNDKFENAVKSILNPRLDANILNTITLTLPWLLSIIAPILRYIIHKEFDNFRNFIFVLIHSRSNVENSNTLLEFLNYIKVNNQNKFPQIGFDNEDIIQEIMTYCTTSYESNSGTMAFMIYELALNQDIQNKCYENVIHTLEKYNQNFSLECLLEMKYLDMVLHETMRMHPLSHAIDRRCVSKFKFPNLNLTIDENVLVYAPVHGLQHDPNYFPRPEVLNPVRFSNETKSKIPQCTYLPFGGGPRICIGTRLAKLIVLMCISKLLMKFNILPCEKTKLDLKLDPKRIRVVSILDGLWIRLEKR